MGTTANQYRDRVRPPQANLAELQALDDLRRAWADLATAEAAHMAAVTPSQKGAATSYCNGARSRIRHAHAALDALLRRDV